jgi:tetratricopeptide (TPR) repeat protein
MALYDAFISYSHAKDKPIAAALQSAVQKLGKPWYRRRALRIFRDDTSLSATPTLWPSIEAALGSSRYLILLASPEAAASVWVNKEVAHWLEHKPAGTLLIAVTNGELAWDEAANDFGMREQHPLPPALRGRFTSEPKWVDLRAYRGGANPRDDKFRELAADFAAVVHGMPKEDLLSQELRQQRNVLRAVLSAAAVLLAALGFAGWEWKQQLDATHLAEQQRDRAERALKATADTVTNVSGGIVAGLRSRVGMPPDLSRDILTFTSNLNWQVANEVGWTPGMSHAEAGALHELAKVQLQLGEVKNALSSAERSANIMDKLAKQAPDDLERQHDRMVSMLLLANVTAASGKRELALTIYQREIERTETSYAAHFDEESWQKTMGAAYEQHGNLLLAGGQHGEALAAYQKSLTMAERRAATDPEDGNKQRADLNARIGGARLAAGDKPGATAAYEESLAISRDAAQPNNILHQRIVAFRLDDVGSVRRATGSLDGALTAYEESLAIRRQLAADDPENIGWKEELSTSLENLGDVKRAARDWAAALGFYRESLANRRRLAAIIRGQPQWQHAVSVSLQRIGDVELEADHLPEALAAYQEHLEISRKLANAVASNTDWQWGLALAHGRVAGVLELQERRAEAIESYRHSVVIAETLTKADPANATWQRGRMRYLERVAMLQEAQGERDAAIEAFRKLIWLREQRLAADPNDAEQPQQLAANALRLGDLLTAAGQREHALDYYREHATLLAKLAGADPADVRKQWDLARGHEKVADTLKALKRRREAADAYRSEVAALERGAASDRNSAKDQVIFANALAIGRSRIGDELLALKQRDAALAEYHQSQAIIEGLTAAEPDNRQRPRDLAAIHQKTGYALELAGRRAAALAEYHTSRTIRDGLIAAEPANTQWQMELASTLTAIGNVAEPSEARAALRQALAILDPLAAADQIPAAQRNWPQTLRDRLAKLAPEQAEAK